MPKKPYHDPGLIPGSLAVLVVLLFWLLVTLRIGADDPGAPSAEEPAPPPAPTISPAPPPTVVKPLSEEGASSSSSVPAGLQADPRWAEAVRLGDAAIQGLKDAMREQEQRGGVNLHAYQVEARDSLERSLKVLESLAQDYPVGSPAGQAIAGQRRKYEKELGYTRK